MGRSRVHKSRYKGGKRVGGGLRNPGGGKSSKGIQWGRYARHEGGAVPQRQMTPQQRLFFLDENGFTAVKEREKCAKRIKIQQSKNQQRSKRDV